MSVNDLPMPNASNYLPSLWNVDVRRRGVRGADVGVNHLTVDTDGRLHAPIENGTNFPSWFQKFVSLRTWGFL